MTRWADYIQKNGTPKDLLKSVQQAVSSRNGQKPTLKELVVLAPNKDPYNTGSNGDKDKALWFKEWFEGATGKHIRAVHYRIVSNPGERRPDGQIYQNDQKNWDYLNHAARVARYLGEVDPEDLDDRRNPPVIINMAPPAQDEPSFTYETDMHGLDFIGTTLRVDPFYSPLLDVKTEVYGYLYEEGMQPYHLEVWAEKSTANSALVPLCREFGVNYVSGAGYMSVTAVVELLRHRIRELGKPVRIFYISDYDKSGENMPRQMSRQTQFWTHVYSEIEDEEFDVKVEPIVMTEEQAEKYPSAPDSNKVELDAMLELDPGRLEEIVREHLESYRDFGLEDRVEEAGQEAQETVDEAVQEVLQDELEELEEIKRDVDKIYKAYRGPLKRLALELNRELEPYNRRLESVQQAVRRKLEQIEVELPELPESEMEENTDREWLYSSDRDYMEQLEVYDERKGVAQ